jgi:radical S-adenosyl methionine domain-containing protein 2
MRLVEVLAPVFRKMTFAGGEPMLCPWLPELVRAAKARGMVTMLVTNGSRLSSDAIDALTGALDWVTLSIDSADARTHAELGRAVRGKAIPMERYAATAERTRAAGMRIKVNTVVTNLNAGEDLSPLLRALRPERWKILRVLPIAGQNDGSVEPLLCSTEEFEGFVERHRGLAREGITLVPEDHDDIRGSYAMIDPAGRFFDDLEGVHRYSDPILDVGVEAAWSMVRFSLVRFTKRGGDYVF